MRDNDDDNDMNSINLLSDDNEEEERISDRHVQNTTSFQDNDVDDDETIDPTQDLNYCPPEELRVSHSYNPSKQGNETSTSLVRSHAHNRGKDSSPSVHERDLKDSNGESSDNDPKGKEFSITCTADNGRSTKGQDNIHFSNDSIRNNGDDESSMIISPGTRTLNNLSLSQQTTSLRYDLSQLNEFSDAESQQKKYIDVDEKENDAAHGFKKFTKNHDKNNKTDINCEKDDDSTGLHRNKKTPIREKSKRSNHNSLSQKPSKRKCYPVEIIKIKTGKVIASYPSLTQASKHLKVHKPKLIEYIRKQIEQPGGVMYRYCNTNNNYNNTEYHRQNDDDNFHRDEKLLGRTVMKVQSNDTICKLAQETDHHNLVQQQSGQTKMITSKEISQNRALVRQASSDISMAKQCSDNQAVRWDHKPVMHQKVCDTNITARRYHKESGTHSSRNEGDVISSENSSSDETRHTNLQRDQDKSPCLVMAYQSNTQDEEKQQVTSTGYYNIRYLTINKPGPLGFQIAGCKPPDELVAAVLQQHASGLILNYNQLVKQNSHIKWSDEINVEKSMLVTGLMDSSIGGDAGIKPDDWLFYVENDKGISNCKQKGIKEHIVLHLDYEKARDVSKQGLRPLTFAVARWKLAPSAEKHVTSFSGLSHAKETSEIANCASIGSIIPMTFDRSSGPTRFQSEAPFCTLCTQSKNACAAGKRVKAHHSWCPRNPHFQASGSDMIYQRMRMGVESGCAACMFEFSYGKYCSEEIQCHSRVCKMKQNEIKQQKKKERETQKKKETKIKFSKKRLKKKLCNGRKEQKAEKVKTFIRTKTDRLSDSYTSEESSISVDESESAYRSETRRPYGLVPVTRANRALSSENTAQQVGNDGASNRKKMVVKKNITIAAMNDEDESIDDDSCENLVMQWEACENPWGDEGHRDGDLVIFRSIPTFGEVETLNPDGEPRFALYPFSALPHRYSFTHHTPEEGFQSIILQRNTLGTRPWGFSVHLHEFGGACLVHDVDLLSPATSAVRLPVTSVCNLCGVCLTKSCVQTFLGAGPGVLSPLRVNDMILEFNGKRVGGMTLFSLTLELEVCGPQLTLLVSRYKFADEIQRQMVQAETRYLKTLDTIINDERRIDWTDIGNTLTEVDFGNNNNETRRPQSQAAKSDSENKIGINESEVNELLAINKSSCVCVCHNETIHKDLSQVPHEQEIKNQIQHETRMYCRLRKSIDAPNQMDSFLSKHPIQADYLFAQHRESHLNRSDDSSTKSDGVDSEKDKVLIANFTQKDSFNGNSVAHNPKILGKHWVGSVDGGKPQSTASCNSQVFLESSSSSLSESGESNKTVTSETYIYEQVGDDDTEEDDDGNAQFHCVCGIAHKGSTSLFWVQCDSCRSWFNVANKCIGFTAAEAQSIGPWTCPGCPTLSVNDDKPLSSNPKGISDGKKKYDVPKPYRKISYGNQLLQSTRMDSKIEESEQSIPGDILGKIDDCCIRPTKKSRQNIDEIGVRPVGQHRHGCPRDEKAGIWRSTSEPIKQRTQKNANSSSVSKFVSQAQRNARIEKESALPGEFQTSKAASYSEYTPNILEVFKVGDLVEIKEHSWPGVNNVAGIAKVVDEYRDEDGDQLYDIKYIVDRKLTRNVLAQFVSKNRAF